MASVRGESSGSNRTICRLDTTAWTVADRENPRTSAQRISQNIANAIPSACAIAWTSVANVMTSRVRSGRPGVEEVARASWNAAKLKTRAGEGL